MTYNALSRFATIVSPVALALTLWTGNSIAVAQEVSPSPELQVATRYIEAYGAADFETLSSLYAEDAVFVDPTSKGLPNGGYDFQGREEILTGLKAAFRNPQTSLEEAHYETPNGIYESSGHTVFAGRLVMTWRLNDGSGRFRISAPIVTVVQVVDGQVIGHRDYADYRGMKTERLE